MTVTVNLVAADGATSSITLPDPTVNSAGVTLPFSNQMLIFGGMALDATNGTLALTTPTGSPGQLWTQQHDAASGITYLQPGTGWLAIDFTTSPLAVGVPWLNTASGNSCIVAADGSGVSVSAWVPSAKAAEYLAGTAMQAAAFEITLQAPAPPPVQSSYAPSNYVKVWEDTFTGTSLDTTKWWTRYAGNDGTQQNISSNGELELFSESNNHVMTGNSVKLTAYPPASGSSNYLSGMLRCKQTLNLGSLTTGFYVEVVMKVPNAQGAWPAFWFSAEPHSATVPAPWPPEMDAAEFMINSANGDTSSMVGVNVQLNGQNPPNVWNSDNWSYGSNVPAGWQWSATGRTKWVTPTDFSTGFHIFGFQCVPGIAGQRTVNPITGQPTHMLYYFVDGYNTFSSQYDSNVGADGSTGWNSELLLDLAVGGMGGGTPNPAQFPCAFEIQRVSIYLSQQDSAALVPSTIGQDFMPATGG